MAIDLKQYAYRREGDDVVLGEIIIQKKIYLADALVMASNMLYSLHTSTMPAKVEEMGETEVAISCMSFLPEEAAGQGLGPGLWHGYWYIFSQPVPALPAPSYHDILQFKEMLMGYATSEEDGSEKTS
jgi:hypothetical protein